MKKQLLTRISAVCTNFTLVVLGSVIYNMLKGYSSGWPTLLLFVWLVLFQAVDYLLSLIPFRTCRQYRLCRMAANYLLVLAIWWWMSWLPHTLWGFLFFTVIYFAFFKLIQSICHAWRQAEADEINHTLEQRRKNAEPEDPSRQLDLRQTQHQPPDRPGL